MQQEINKTYISKTSEISNDSATKDQSHNTKYSNNSSGQMIEKKKDKNDRKKVKSVIILWHSTVKHISGWEILQRLQQCRVYVKYFSIAKTQYMRDYLKPWPRQNPSHFVLHMGTNNLKSEKSFKR